MEKKTPLWHYLLIGLGVSGIFNTWGNPSLEARVAMIISAMLLIVFGVIIPLKK